MTLKRSSYELKRGGIRSRLVWSGLFPVRPTSPLLWTNGRPGRSVTEILQKRHMRDTCSFSHHLCQLDGDRREGGVSGCESCPWSELCLTYLLNVKSCIFIRLPQAEEGREEVLNVAFQLFIQVFFQTFFLSPLFSHAWAPILRCGLVKVTLQCPTWCD